LPSHRAGCSPLRSQSLTRGSGHGRSHPGGPAGPPRELTRLVATVLAATAALAFGGLVSTASAEEDSAEPLNLSSPSDVSLAAVPPHVRDDVVIKRVVTSPEFEDTYAGHVAREDGGVTIYATRSGISRLARALERELGPEEASTYELRPAAMSYRALDALSKRVSESWHSMKKDGVKALVWGPDPASNTVEVEIADYTPERARLVKDRFGHENVTVVQATYTEPMRPLRNRFYDEPFFYNGVFLWFDGYFGCTHSYVVRGNASGNKFGLTAGHCTGDFVYTNRRVHYTMGRVSTNYYDPVGGWDLESFRCDTCSTKGKVYYEGRSSVYWEEEEGDTHLVGGVCTWCDELTKPRQRVAIDGAVTGQVINNDVVTLNKCFLFEEAETGTVAFPCHLNRTTNLRAYDLGFKACDHGDSGGPVYQRSSFGVVYAAGVLVGGNEEGWICLYHDMSRVLDMTNTSLITAPYPTTP
jgi:hypothetical protein